MVQVGLRVVARAVGIARKDRDIAAAIDGIAVSARAVRQPCQQKQRRKTTEDDCAWKAPLPATTILAPAGFTSA